jgi:hypothetical protein
MPRAHSNDAPRRRGGEDFDERSDSSVPLEEESQVDSRSDAHGRSSRDPGRRYPQWDERERSHERGCGDDAETSRGQRGSRGAGSEPAR